MRPLVFLHGFLGDPTEWQHVIEALPQDRSCQSLALPAAEDWQSAVREITEQILIPSILIGYSMGARLALGCAVAAPERVSHLCFISGNPGLEENERDQRWKHDQAIARRLLTEPAREFLEKWYQQPVFSSVPNPIKSHWIDERQVNIDPDRQSKLIASLSVAKQPNYWEDLSSLSCPMTVVVGDGDEKYLTIGRAIRRKSRAQLKVITGAGHAVHRERPLDVARVLSWVDGQISTET